MTLIVPWLVFPLVLALLSLGCGLLAELVAAVRLPTALLLPTGFALVIVAAQLATLTAATAPFAAPAVVALAVVGLGLSRSLRRRPDPWALLGAATAYGAYAAPVVLSGRATFAGYIKLDDTATSLAMLDRVLTHGPSLAGLVPSTYEATLSTSLAYGYPVGSFVPLGIGHELLGQDAAWLWQPYLAFLGALLALGLYALTDRLIESRPLRAMTAAVAAQPALLYGYSLWGGIKELAAAALLPASAALALVAVRAGSIRAVVPLAASSAALVGVLSVGAGAWLAPLLLGALALLVGLRGTSFALRSAAVFLASALVLAIPSLVSAAAWLPRSKGFASESEFGNLIRPLRWLQVFGVWLVGDFRRSPSDAEPTYVLVAVVAAAAALGLSWALARRRWEVLIYAGTVGVGAAAIVLAGSPWVAAKALAIASPAPLLLGLLGSGAFLVRGRRVEAAVLAAAVAGGVVWSNVLAYREVWLAPRSRLVELQRIGERYAGEGPALMTEFEPYGVRHFLRDLDAEGTSELRRRIVPLRSGQPLAPQAYADVDRFRLDDLLVYRTLVLRRSPVASRPPSVYRLVARGRWYEVWQRSPTATPPILEHVPLGDEFEPGAVPPCAQIERLSRLPGVSRLAVVPRAPLRVLALPQLPHPAAWQASGYGLYADGAGTVAATVAIAVPGDYSFWVGGTFLGRLELDVGRYRVGARRQELEWSGQFVELGRTRMTAGRHRVSLRYGGSDLHPGSAGLAPFPLDLCVSRCRSGAPRGPCTRRSARGAALRCALHARGRGVGTTPLRGRPGGRGRHPGSRRRGMGNAARLPEPRRRHRDRALRRPARGRLRLGLRRPERRRSGRCRGGHGNQPAARPPRHLR